MKKALVLLLSLLLAFNLCGCWNYRELEGLSTVTGVAVDKAPDGTWLVTAEIVDFAIGNGGDSSPKSNLVCAKGKTLFDAIRNMIEVSSQKLYWSHALSFIISKEVAKDGLRDLADWILRNPELRSEIVIFVSREDTARAILNLQAPNNNFVGYAIYTTLRSMQSVSKTSFELVHEFASSFEGCEETVMLPVVGSVEVEGKHLISVAGGAYFDKDKLAGFLSPDDMFYWSFLQDEAEGGIINVPYGAKKTDYVGLEIKHSSTKIKPKALGGASGPRVSISVEIDTQATVGDVETGIDILEKDELKRFIKAAQSTVETGCLDLIAQTRGEGIDLFGFGSQVKDTLPQLWKQTKADWPNQLRIIPISVQCKLTLLHYGEINQVITAD